jgi:tetratricopeptide (TPR) repeat protein
MTSVVRPGAASERAFETIAPAEVRPGQPAAAVSTQVLPGTIAARSVLLGLLALLALAALLWWALPRWTAAPAPPRPAIGDAQPAAAATAASATAPAEPWNDPAVLRARQAAQTLAASVAERQAALRAQGVERWADVAFRSAGDQALRAAGHFDARRFVEAEADYEAADRELAALQQDAPRQFARALQDTDAALQADDAQRAEAALALARAIDAEDPEVAAATRRLAAVPAVRAALAQAAAATTAGDPAAAEQAYRAALDADGAHRGAQQGLDAVRVQRRGERFAQALGAALAALDAGRLDAADAALAQAQALRADDPGVQAARARLTAARIEAQIDTALRAAAAAEAAEDWAAAVAHYRKALALDPSRVAAQAGLAAAQPRAALASALQAIPAQPQRLTTAAGREQAARTLAQARAVTAAGPRLRQQIAEVETVLTQASTPVTVQLRSDGQTEVTIYRVGAQGRFAERRIDLLPGKYVAVGARSGYQDVRVEFEVLPGAAPEIVVRCERPL